MNVDSILISEFATVDSNMSLTVVRTFNVLEAAGFPVQIPLVSVSAIIHAHLSEAGSEHELRLTLMNSRRETLRGTGESKIEQMRQREEPDE